MSAEDYIEELLDEKDRLDPGRSLHSIRLLEDEIQRVGARNEGRLLEDEIHRVGASNEETRYNPPPQMITNEETRYNPTPQMITNEGTRYNLPPQMITNNAVQYTEEVIKLSEKIVLPTEEYPKFNFVGKIIGPKGSTLKGIQASTKARISILGRGSTRDKEKEEEWSQSDNPKFEHFKEPLHVLIQVEAARSDAHARLADALDEINKCMAPDNNNDRYKDPFLADHMGTKFNGGGRQLPTPIIRVGIPPPGAMVLNEHPHIAHRSPEISRHVERPRF